MGRTLVLFVFLGLLATSSAKPMDSKVRELLRMLSLLENEVDYEENNLKLMARQDTTPGVGTDPTGGSSVAPGSTQNPSGGPSSTQQAGSSTQQASNGPSTTQQAGSSTQQASSGPTQVTTVQTPTSTKATTRPPTSAQTTTRQPTSTQTTTRQPTSTQTTTRQPTSTQTTTRQPTSTQTTTRQPTSSQATTQPPTSTQTTTRQPTSTRTTTRQPTSTQATTRPPTSTQATTRPPTSTQPTTRLPTSTQTTTSRFSTVTTPPTSGKFCRPGGVVFSAVRTTDISKSGDVTFDRELVNIGKAFQNPYFSAPCNAIYRIELNFEYGYSLEGTYIEIVKEGTVIMRRLIANQCDCDGKVFAFSQLVELDIGQRLWVRSDNKDNIAGNYHYIAITLIETTD